MICFMLVGLNRWARNSGGDSYASFEFENMMASIWYDDLGITAAATYW